MQNSFSAFIFIVLLTSCAKPYTTQSEGVALPRHDFTAQMKASFSGRYASVCHPTEFRGMELYETSDESFDTLLQFHRWSRYFSDANCQIPFAEGKVDGAYQFFNNQKGDEDFGIIFFYDAYYFLPETRQISTLMNESQFCGHRDWQSQYWTNTVDHKISDAMWMAPGDDELNTIYRTECSTKHPGKCLQIRLSRLNSLNEIPESH